VTVGRDGALRVAIFTDTFAPQMNGVARTLDRLAGAIRERGGEAAVVTVDAPGAVKGDVVRWPAVPFWRYPELRVAAPLAGAARRLVRAMRPDLVHVATPFGVGLAGRRAACLEGVPLVSSFHTDFAQYLSYYNLKPLESVTWPYLRWFHNAAARTFVPTRFGAKALVARRFERVSVWGRGVDRRQFSPSFRSYALRHAMGIRDNEILVASVGRLAPEKGVGVLLRAMARVHSIGGNRVRLALAGDGPAESQYRAEAPPGTVFAGRLTGTRLSEFYASADVFVFASTTDTFGNVLLEAMASGLPVIAPDRGPTVEIAGGENALLVAVEDATALANGIQQLTASAALRRRLVIRSLATAAARDWTTVWDDLFSQYRAVAGAQPPWPRGPRLSPPRDRPA
jgi:glycosyltransferase involved in cell wall biosynthesis